MRRSRAALLSAGVAFAVASTAFGVAVASPTVGAAAAHTPADKNAGQQHLSAARAAAISDPSQNTPASQAFLQACYTKPVDNSRCDGPALTDFDKARAKEGLGPMTLPSDFDSLPKATQLFVVANIDRVDHGLAAVSAMSNSLNSLADGGAKADNDPDFPNPPTGEQGGSNWAGVGSALLAEFLWVYDDGPGSGNLDCPKSGGSGCWDHRHNVLASYSSPILMGAAEEENTSDGQSIGEEFIGGDTGDTANKVKWGDYKGLLPVGLSATSLSASGNGGKASLTAWASGESMSVSAAVTSGGDRWSVSPKSCSLSAGHTCALTVTYNPAAGTSTTGTLTVTGPNGPRTVALSSTAPTASPSSSASPSASSSPTSTQTATSSPTSGSSGPPTSGPTGQPTSGPTGQPTSGPTASASPSSTSTSGGSGSRPVPRVRISHLHRKGHRGGHSRLVAAVSPAQNRQLLVLQVHKHGGWRTLHKVREHASGRCAFKVALHHRGTRRYRVLDPATTRHRRAVSHVVTIRVR